MEIYDAPDDDQIYDVQRREPVVIGPPQPIPVVVEGYVRTKDLPPRLGGSRTYTLTAGAAPTRILSGDETRISALLVYSGGDTTVHYVRLGGTEAQAENGPLVPLHNAASYTFRTQSEIWAAVPSGADPCTIGVIQEQWTR